MPSAPIRISPRTVLAWLPLRSKKYTAPPPSSWLTAPNLPPSRIPPTTPHDQRRRRTGTTQYSTLREGISSSGRSHPRKRLCRLRLQLGPGLRLSLNFQIVEILPVAHAVAENLLLAGQILRRTEHP